MIWSLNEIKSDSYISTVLVQRSPHQYIFLPIGAVKSRICEGGNVVT